MKLIFSPENILFRASSSPRDLACTQETHGQQSGDFRKLISPPGSGDMSTRRPPLVPWRNASLSK